ncbi:MAG: response regulator [Hyphomonadaceae bacterium]
MQKRVLLIDHNADTARRLTKRFCDRRWVVLSSNSVRGALEICESISVKLAVIDAMADDGQALDALPMLRDRLPGTPIAAMAGRYGLRGRHAHTCEFVLPKPLAEFDVDDLIDDAGRIARGEGPRPHILGADDKEGACSVIRSMARVAGYRASFETCMEAMLQRLKWDRADCLLVDIFMPGMGGIDGIRKVRAERPDLPVIAMSSGLHARMDAETSLKAARMIGADGALKKPFTAEQLRAAACAAIAARRGAMSFAP